jgi:hypothetical protein
MRMDEESQRKGCAHNLSLRSFGPQMRGPQDDKFFANLLEMSG